MTSDEDLLIDDSLFRVMPVLDLDSSFGSEMTVYEQIEMELPVQDDDASPNVNDDTDNNNGNGSVDVDLVALNHCDDRYFRLSLVDFGCGRRSGIVPFREYITHDEPTDELHSELYSLTLESLRDEIVRCFPQLETMVSRAVIHAFSPTTTTKKSMRHCSVVVEEERHAVTARHNEYMMQQQLNAAFAHVRNGKMSPDAAARQILEHAAICGLECTNDTPAFTHDPCSREQCTDDSISVELTNTSLEDDCNESWDGQIEHNNILCDVPHLMGSLRDINIDIDDPLQSSNHGESKTPHSSHLLESDMCSPPSSTKISVRTKSRPTSRIELRSE